MCSGVSEGSWVELTATCYSVFVCLQARRTSQPISCYECAKDTDATAGRGPVPDGLMDGMQADGTNRLRWNIANEGTSVSACYCASMVKWYHRQRVVFLFLCSLIS